MFMRRTDHFSIIICFPEQTRGLLNVLLMSYKVGDSSPCINYCLAARGVCRNSLVFLGDLMSIEHEGSACMCSKQSMKPRISNVHVGQPMYSIKNSFSFWFYPFTIECQHCILSTFLSSVKKWQAFLLLRATIIPSLHLSSYIQK